MYKILCFDSSNNQCSVSVTQGEQILAYCEETRPSMQAEMLLSLIEQALRSAKMDYQDMDYLATTIGPGSFTGIRIALASAKALIYATNMKSIGITNFEVCFYRLKQQVKKFDKAIIFIEAYRNQQYMQVFDYSGLAIGAGKLIDNNQAPQILEQYTGQKIAIAGSGVQNIYPLIHHNELMILPRFPVIRCYHTARLAHQLISQGIKRDIEPLYIRAPDAVRQV